MFDIGWSELLVIGVVTLIMVGPKELPVFLRTIGKYVGMLRRQAAEFRSQFDAALRETELEQIRRDMAGLKDDVSGTMRAAQTQMESELNATGKALGETATALERPVVTSQTVRDEEFTDENGLPFKPTPSYEDLVSPDARQAPPGARELTAAEMAAEGAETAAIAATTGPVKAGNGTANAHHVNGSGAASTSRGEA